MYSLFIIAAAALRVRAALGWMKRRDLERKLTGEYCRAFSPICLDVLATQHAQRGALGVRADAFLSYLAPAGFDLSKGFRRAQGCRC